MTEQNPQPMPSGAPAAAPAPTATIDTSAVDLDAMMGLAPAPATPTTTALVQQVEQAVALDTDPVTAVMVRDQLSPAMQEQARAAAARLLPVLLADPNKLAEVGQTALDEINRVSEEFFHTMVSQDGVKIPELNEYTKELQRAVRGFTSRNERNTAMRRNIEAYEGFKKNVMEFIHRNRDWLRELLADAQGLERRMDSITAAIIEKQGVLRRNVDMCNEIYAVNERAVVQLVVATAIMEYLHDHGREAMNGIVVEAGDPHAREKNEQREQMRTLLEQLEVRVSEFRQRLFVAIATSPQIRNVRTLNYSLGQRLGMIVNLTIPAFKLTVVQWAMMIQAEQGAEVTQGAIAFNNDVLQGFANATGQGIDKVARVVQAPSTSPETIMAIAQSLDRQVQSFDAAYAQGVKARAAVDQAIAKASRIIVEAPGRRTQEIIDLARAGATPMGLDVAEPLPAEVLELAPALKAGPR